MGVQTSELAVILRQLVVKYHTEFCSDRREGNANGYYRSLPKAVLDRCSVITSSTKSVPGLSANSNMSFYEIGLLLDVALLD